MIPLLMCIVRKDEELYQFLMWWKELFSSFKRKIFIACLIVVSLVKQL